MHITKNGIVTADSHSLQDHSIKIGTSDLFSHIAINENIFPQQIDSCLINHIPAVVATGLNYECQPDSALLTNSFIDTPVNSLVYRSNLLL